MSLDDYNEMRGMKDIVDSFIDVNKGTHEAVMASNHGTMYLNLSKKTIEECYRQLCSKYQGRNITVDIKWSD